MRLRSSCLVPVLALCSGIALAQTPPAPGTPPSPAAPVEAAPAPAAPPGGQAAPQPAPQAQSTPEPAPVETPSQPQAPAAAESVPAPSSPAPVAPASPAQAPARTTLFPNPGDPTTVEEGVLAAKPAAVLSGTSTWEEGYANLKAAFARIEEELKKAGIAPTGRPLTIFVDTDDKGFRYEAMIPVAQAPEGHTELTPEIRFGKTPEGKSYRFVHKDAYDEIDGTYETITAYLDAKEVEAKDVFVEEYVTDLTDSKDTDSEVNIYVQPKD